MNFSCRQKGSCKSIIFCKIKQGDELYELIYYWSLNSSEISTYLERLSNLYGRLFPCWYHDAQKFEHKVFRKYETGSSSNSYKLYSSWTVTVLWPSAFSASEQPTRRTAWRSVSIIAPWGQLCASMLKFPHSPCQQLYSSCNLHPNISSAFLFLFFFF